MMRLVWDGLARAVYRPAIAPVVARLVLARAKRRERRWSNTIFFHKLPWWYRWYARTRRRLRLPRFTPLEWLGARSLPPLAGGAVNTFTNGGGTEKWATAGNWSGGVPKAAEDCIVPTGKKVKIEAAAECRSVVVEGTGTVAGASALTIGNSEEPKPTGFVGYALVIASTATWSHTGKVFLNGTTGAEVKIKAEAKLAGALELKAKATSKYKLEAALETGKGLGLAESTSLKTGGFNVTLVETAVFTVSGPKANLEAGSSTITAPEISLTDSEPTFSIASASFVVTANKGQFATHTTLTVKEIRFEAAEHSLIGQGAVPAKITLTKLAVTKAGMELKFGQAENAEEPKIKLEELEVAGSKAGSLTSFLNGKAGTTFFLEFGKSGVVVKNLKLKDCHATAAHEPTNEYEGVTEAEVKGSNVEFWKFTEVGGTTPAKLEPAAAKSKSAASSGLSAPMPLVLAAAKSKSVAAATVSTAMRLAHTFGVSISVASTQLGIPTALSTAAAKSRSSSPTFALSAATLLTLATPKSRSSAAGGVTATTILQPLGGHSSSNGSAKVRVLALVVPGTTKSKSTASLPLIVTTRLKGTFAISVSEGKLTVAIGAGGAIPAVIRPVNGKGASRAQVTMQVVTRLAKTFAVSISTAQPVTLITSIRLAHTFGVSVSEARLVLATPANVPLAKTFGVSISSARAGVSTPTRLAHTFGVSVSEARLTIVLPGAKTAYGAGGTAVTVLFGDGGSSVAAVVGDGGAMPAVGGDGGAGVPSTRGAGGSLPGVFATGGSK